LIAGCDKIPGLSLKKSGQADSGSPATVVPSRPAVAPDEVIATVNDVPLSKQDLEFRVLELKSMVAASGQEWKPLTEQQLTAIVDELVNNELMSQDAAARGVDRSTEARRRWEYLRRNFFVQEWVRGKQGQLDVSSAEVEEYYEKNKPGFRVPERRKLRQISVASEEQAKSILARLLEGNDFSAMAKESSIAPSAPTGGLIPGWVMRANEKAFLYRTDADASAQGVTSLNPALEASAFAIDRVNGLSSYVKGPDNRFHVFQLVEKEGDHTRALKDVWDQIKAFLLMQKAQKEIDALKQAAKVEKFPERASGVTQ
jgi:peptidyl-prolyl cis-trans isomerase C